MVGIGTATHTGQGMTTLGSLTGRLERKFALLTERTALQSAEGVALHQPTPPNFYFAASETAQDVADEYQRYLELPTLFGTGDRQYDKEVRWATGFASQQDELAMSFTPTELEEKMAALADSRTFEDLQQTYRLCREHPCTPAPS